MEVDYTKIRVILEHFSVKCADDKEIWQLKNDIDFLINILNSDLFNYVINSEKSIQQLSHAFRSHTRDIENYVIEGIPFEVNRPIDYKFNPSGNVRISTTQTNGFTPDSDMLLNGKMEAKLNSSPTNGESAQTKSQGVQTPYTCLTKQEKSNVPCSEEPGFNQSILQHYRKILNVEEENCEVVFQAIRFDEEVTLNQLFNFVSSPSPIRAGTYEHRIFSITHAKLLHRLYAHDQILEINGISCLDMSGEEFRKIFCSLPKYLHFYVAREKSTFAIELTSPIRNECSTICPIIPPDSYSTGSLIDEPVDQQTSNLMQYVSPRRSSLPSFNVEALQNSVNISPAVDIPTIDFDSDATPKTGNLAPVATDLQHLDHTTLPRIDPEEMTYFSVHLDRSEELGFGMSISNKKCLQNNNNSGIPEVVNRVVVIDVKSNGPAEAARKISTGDFIEKIDNVDVRAFTHRQVSEIMRQPDRKSIDIVFSRISMATPLSSVCVTDRCPQQDQDSIPSDCAKLESDDIEQDMQYSSILDAEIEEVVITRPSICHSFGFTVVGGFCLTTGQLPIFVKSVSVNGPAYVANLKVNDRVITVNEVDITGFTHDNIVSMMRQSSKTLRLGIIRP